jgi:hypothetical protein
LRERCIGALRVGDCLADAEVRDDSHASLVMTPRPEKPPRASARSR